MRGVRISKEKMIRWRAVKVFLDYAALPLEKECCDACQEID